MNPILSVSNLTFSYDGDSPALKGISFDVEEGSYVAIIGHNGSGKSTLAKLLLGLMNGFKGTIRVFGTELSRKTLYQIRSRVGIVFQNPDNQFVGSTVADDIAFGLENRKVPHDQMQGIIEKFADDAGMRAFLDHAPENLSGGQKQRVAIAGVLAMHPDIVILDEATAMLDPKGKHEIRDLIAKMKQENPKLTILSITHDIEEAANSDKVVVLDSGNLILQGKPDEVFSHVDALNAARLGIPFVIALKHELASRGIEVPSSIKTLEQMEDYLCQ